MKNIRFGACLPTFGSCADRYCLSGYSEPKTLEEMFDSATKVKDLKGIELVGNWHINDKNMKKLKKIISDRRLEVCMLTPDLWTQAKWGKGSLASNDAKVRKEAIAEIKKVMDWANEMKCEYIDVWLGQDGFDYCFQADFEKAWKNIVSGIKECANYRKDVKICIEYKIKEPRTHIFIGTAAKTLLLLNEVNEENVGALIDVGHSLAAGENVAESISLLNGKNRKKLFYMHFNDNYRSWDDDMMVGSVHIIEFLELLYWLKRTEYNGWYTLDIFPYRENGVKAATESIEWIKGMIKLLDKIGYENITKIIDKDDATLASSLIRKVLLR